MLAWIVAAFYLAGIIAAVDAVMTHGLRKAPSPGPYRCFDFRRFQLIEGMQGGEDNVQNIAVAQRFGQDIGNPSCFDHCTHTAAGNYAGAWGGRLEQDS